jgi:PAS domain S-box-containing protein
MAGFGEAVRVTQRRSAEQKERLQMSLASDNHAYLNAWAESLAGWANRMQRAARPRLAYLVLFATAYVLTGGFGQGLALIPGVAITFWPPAGIFVAALLLNPRPHWWWYVLAAGLAELACNAIWFHNPLRFALVYFSANALEALAAAWLLGRFAARPFRFESPGAVAAFVGLGASVAPVIGATVIATTDALIGKHPFWTAWPLVWLGDASGLLVSTPIALAMGQAWREKGRISTGRLLEAAAIAVLLIGVAALALRHDLLTAYVTMPLVLWAALRFRLHGAAVALALVAITAAAFTVIGTGEFAGQAEELHARVVLLQTFLGVTAISALLVATLSHQHWRAVVSLKAAKDDLERQVLERTAGLRTSEIRYRRLFEAAHDGVLILDPDTRKIVDANPFMTSLLGYTHDQLIGMELYEIGFVADEKASRDAFQALKATRKVRYENLPLQSRDGGHREVEVVANLYDEDSRPIVQCNVRDITERKQAEAALREKTHFLQQIADVTPGVLYVFDLVEQRSVFINRSVASLLGYSPEEILAMGTEVVSSLMHPDDRPRFEQHLGRISALAEGEVAEFEHRMRDRAGQWHCFLSSDAIFTRNDTGAVQQIIGVATEITARKRAEEELRRLSAELSEADRRKDEFLATLAHELRNPLAPLRNGLQIMRLSNDSGPKVEKTRAMMERQLERMVHLVDDLLDVSRISRGKFELRKQRIELAEVLNSAVETSRPLIEAGGHELTVVLPPQAVFIDADMTRLGQVFANLLNNAAKYSERGGHIRLAAECQGSDVVVSVKDTGIGIPPEMLSKVFDMFMQVDRSLEKAQGGLGIGLSLVQRLVEMHGGSVQARSEGCGLGSEFVVRLPALPALAAVHESQPPADEGEPLPSSGQRRILVADDNPDSANTLSMLLTLTGNEVLTASDGLQAVDVAAAFRPDVILLDIGMPKLNGYESCRRIRQQPWGKEPVIIALTGWGQDDDKRRSQEAGFNYHIVKPIDPAALEMLLAGLQPVEDTG